MVVMVVVAAGVFTSLRDVVEKLEVTQTFEDTDILLAWVHESRSADEQVFWGACHTAAEKYQYILDVSEPRQLGRSVAQFRGEIAAKLLLLPSTCKQAAGE